MSRTPEEDAREEAKARALANDLARWQGSTERAIAEHARRLDLIDGDAKAARVAAEQTLVAVAVLRVKVALWASLGSLTGAGVVSAIVAYLTK